MSVTAKDQTRNAAFNLPNQLTGLRLILSLVVFVLVAYQFYLPATIIFTVAASTDWLDGYFARRYGQVTMLGRILDPFVDKVIVCGTIIFLAAVPESGIRAWMAVLVVGRELLITALRGLLEQQGVDFSARLSGKLKMVLQCIAIGVSLFYLYLVGSTGEAPAWISWLLVASVWSAVIVTIVSGVVYVNAAVKLLRS